MAASGGFDFGEQGSHCVQRQPGRPVALTHVYPQHSPVPGLGPNPDLIAMQNNPKPNSVGNYYQLVHIKFHGTMHILALPLNNVMPLANPSSRIHPILNS